MQLYDELAAGAQETKLALAELAESAISESAEPVRSCWAYLTPPPGADSSAARPALQVSLEPMRLDIEMQLELAQHGIPI